MLCYGYTERVAGASRGFRVLGMRERVADVLGRKMKKKKKPS